jgi:hypothetical protein
MPPPNKRGRSPAANREDGPKVDAHASEFDSDIIRHADDEQWGKPRGHKLPVAFASQAEPCAGRTLWHAMYKCGSCGGTNFARSRKELTTGKRLPQRGRMVWLVIARTYRADNDRGAAA